MQPIQNVLPPLIDGRTKVIVVGSMPGQQSLDKQQYYGNARNHFWPMIGAVLGVEVPEKYEQRLQLLREQQIGLWDVIAYCERQGSLDATIRNEVPNDFAWLFQKYPQIELMLFNGSKAYDVFKKRVGFTLLEERDYVKMPSTSPIPGKNIKSFDEKVEKWQIMKSYF